MAEMEKKPASEAAKGKKKTVLISMLAFLVTGGGIFLYFVIQGANDITGPGNANFHYGSVMRNSVAPFFKYIGVVGEDEEALAKSAAARLQARGVLPEEAPATDLGDWMKESPAASASASAAAPSGGSGRSGSSYPPANVPRMNASGGGLPRGGGSSNTAGASRFGPGSSSGDVKISGGGRGGAGAGAGAGRQGGTLSALRGSQAALNEGLRSGSAMTARSKWDKSFGVGSTGAGGHVGNMSYGKKGLVDLDTIQSGELKNLKAGEIGGQSIPTTSPPALDAEAAAAKAAEDAASGKTAADAAADAAGQAISNIKPGSGGGPAETKSEPGADPASMKPPEEVTSLARKQSPEGSYCPNGCTIPAACTENCTVYTDSPPAYEKSADGKTWNVVYSGHQIAPDGAVTYYSDVCRFDPKDKNLGDPVSFEGSSSGKMTKVR